MSQPTISLRSTRHSLLARFFATCLVALAVLPFTAPFAICDAAELLADSTAHPVAGTDLKQKQDSAGIASVVTPASLFSASVIVQSSHIAAWIEPRPIRVRVLRI